MPILAILYFHIYYFGKLLIIFVSFIDFSV